MNQHTKAHKNKIVQGLSDALGFARGADKGEHITIFHATEFFIDGMRFNPGTYEIRKVLETDPKDAANPETPF